MSRLTERGTLGSGLTVAKLGIKILGSIVAKQKKLVSCCHMAITHGGVEEAQHFFLTLQLQQIEILNSLV